MQQHSVLKLLLINPFVIAIPKITCYNLECILTSTLVLALNGGKSEKVGAIKVMVVDDSLFSRTFIVEILRDSGLEVVGEADSYDSLIEIYDRCKPDIVTMDIVMPDMDGFECSRALFVKDPNPA